MPSLSDPKATGQQYWRSLDAIADTPEFRRFVHHEFPAGAAEMLDSAQRRHFLKIMAASMALGGMGLGGCRRWPREEIAAFADRPQGRVPGTPTRFATCRDLRGVAIGLLVTAMDGRPIKIEGNPEHPGSRGATDTFAQASVLDLYDPDRSRAVRGPDGQPVTWSAFTTETAGDLAARRQAQGEGLAVLSRASSSPTVHGMRRRMGEQLPRARWFEYEPLANDNEVLGLEMAFGARYRSRYDLERADVIVSLDADFLFDNRDAVRLIRDFADGRRAFDEHKSMNRLYCMESTYSLTGANADHRAAIRSVDVILVAAWLAGRISDDAPLQQFFQDEVPAAVMSGPLLEMLEHALDDLQAHRRRSVIIAGPRQPAGVHALAALMNEALGNVGTTVEYIAAPDAVPQMRSIGELAAAIGEGGISTLVILDGNPAFDAPADLQMAEALARVPTTIHLGDYLDETAEVCTWHVNRAHDLESWGDGRADDGTVSLRQPLIMPLFDGRSDIEVLALVLGDDLSDGYDIVRRTFQEMTGATELEPLWRRTLHDGLLASDRLLPDFRQILVDPACRPETLREASADALGRWTAFDRRSTEVVFCPDASILDGRFANNGWLQELPDPLTKLTWDNAALVSPRTAAQLGVESGGMVDITVDGRSSGAVAVFVLPGHADGSITLPLGYGRRFEGRISTGAGFDFQAIRPSGAAGFAAAAVQNAPGSYVLATTQDHHGIDPESTGGRGVQDRLPTLIRAATRRQYAANPGFANDHHHTGAHVVHRLSMWDETNLQGATYGWGMSIDLSACVGCNSCIVACQAENNIPIVGKDQVLRGREMQWLRLDRYFTFDAGPDGEPDPAHPTGVALQPVPCMHCENAPCEQVCPVAATVHDKDGLNVMVYNRCIGTRYCSNNCPYKVRRFNYFDFRRREPSREQPGVLLAVEPSYYGKPQAADEPLRQMQLNPEVTVRMRGVMEKCTYCVQRIQAAKIDAKNHWVQLAADDPQRQGRVAVEDGAVMTACQQACPADAIAFGDLADPGSRVARLQRHQRAYGMLEEINTKPRTLYLAKLSNPAFGDEADAHHGDDESTDEGGHP